MQPSKSISTARDAASHAAAPARWWSVALPLALAIAAAVLMRWPGLNLPLERDEGAYAYIAGAWLKGELPYRDLFDHKPPLLYILYMPAVVGARVSALSIRLWATIIFLVQLPLLHLLARRVWDQPTAGLAVVLYAVAGSAFSMQGLILNSEQALVLPALLALICLFRGIEADRGRWSFLYGLCVGLIAMIKPTAVPLLVPLALVTGARGMGGRLRRLAFATAGAVIPWLPIVAVWGASNALDDLYGALVLYNRLYAAESVKEWSVAGIVNIVAPLGPLLLCAVGGAALAGWTSVRSRQRMALVLWTLALFGAALLGLRSYVHYYYPVIPGLALLAAPVVTRLARQARGAEGGGRRAVALAGPALLLVVLVVPFAGDNARLLALAPAEQAEALYGRDGKYFFASAAEVADYVRQRTPPGEDIYVWGAEPEIYVLAGRTTSVRYIYDYPLRLIPGARAELEGELRRNPPALWILYHGFVPPGFDAFVADRRLELAATIGGFDIWIPPDPAQ